MRSRWNNNFYFILAAAGSAIGLGNIWKFPYIAGVNGGGIFVFIYIISIFLVGLPIFIAELYIGQSTQKNTLDAFKTLQNKKTKWSVIGWLGLLSAFLILSFYSVVGGWILDYLLQSIVGTFENLNQNEITKYLDTIFNNPARQLLTHFIFMLITMGIVLGGITNGIEKWNKILMPSFFGILIALFIYVIFQPGFSKAFSFLFSFNTSQISGESVLAAIGQAFFSLSLGMGVMITYGSYLSPKENLTKLAISVSIMDTIIALISGIVIFSVVFSYNLAPDSGPGLIFQTLPLLFVQIPNGRILSIAFFLLVSFAAITSAISILQVIVTFLEEKFHLKTKTGTFLCGFLIFLIGILSLLSTNKLSNFKIFGFTFFDLFDQITSNIFLPLGGVLISLFFGWVLGYKHLNKIFYKHPNWVKMIFLWCTRLLAPIAVLSILINAFW